MNPSTQNLGAMPIASAAAACADLNARLPLPLDPDQTRLYRAVFDELGANGTVALRGQSGFVDSESGKLLSYNELEGSDGTRYLGMTRNLKDEIKWRSYWPTKHVYTICEMVSCQSSDSTGDFFDMNT